MGAGRSAVRTGADRGVDTGAAAGAGRSTAPDPEIEPGPPSGEGWKEAIGLAAPETYALLAELSERGKPTPEVGFELAGERAAVLADAELA